jgi:H+/gluconate symporter-like permease
MTAPLTILHSLVPPHPAPAAAAQLLGADLGHAILYGVLLSVPMTLISGMAYGQWIAGRIYIPLPAAALETPPDQAANPPSVAVVTLLLLLPVLLILAATLAPGSQVMALLGHPFSALLVTLIAAMVLLGAARGLNRDEITNLATKSLDRHRPKTFSGSAVFPVLPRFRREQGGGFARSRGWQEGRHFVYAGLFRERNLPQRGSAGSRL